MKETLIQAISAYGKANQVADQVLIELATHHINDLLLRLEVTEKTPETAPANEPTPELVESH